MISRNEEKNFSPYLRDAKTLARVWTIPGTKNLEHRIGGLENCRNVFTYFNNYNLITKKSAAYVAWKEVHGDLLNKNHLDPIKRVELKEKAKLINKFN